MKIGKQRIRRVEIDAKYGVSDDGIVWSGQFPLEPINGEGVNLHGKRVKIAYLVARAFVPNQECRPYVRHKDGDRRNNRAENLEWCDEKEDARRGRKSAPRWIRAWNWDGEVVGSWDCVSDASKATGIPAAAIRACLARKQKQAGGLLWGDLA